MQARILARLGHCGETGATCEELGYDLDLRHQTCGPRLKELATAGRVVDTGMRRRTHSGRKAIVWLAREWA
jgi:hypothetical protein